MIMYHHTYSQYRGLMYRFSRNRKICAGPQSHNPLFIYLASPAVCGRMTDHQKTNLKT